jgi:uncharacterized membrane protein YphA (DoxX/SURF4 family)
MTVLTWFLQALMATLFLVHGLLMIAPPEAIMRRMREQGRAPDFSDSFRVFIGACEVLGASGLVLPALTRILPVLTPLSAVCLTIIMVGATRYHARRNEGWLTTALLGLICAGIAVLRWTVVPL